MATSDSTRIARLVLRIAALGALAFCGAVIAGYYFQGGATFCEPGGGCEDVRNWAFEPDQRIGGFPLGMLLPLLGLTGLTALFAGSLIEQVRTTRIVAVLAVVGALVSIALLVLQATTVKSWCWLCVGVDSLGVVAGAAGVALLVTTRGRPATEGSTSLRSPWWAAWVLVTFTPIAWSFTLPDAAIPPVIRDLYEPGELNVVEVVDFECPYCRALHPVLKSVLDDVEGREVNLVRVMLPLPFHTRARGAARAYFCAERQGAADRMADALFSAEDISAEGIETIARELELDRTAFDRCLEDPAIEARLEEHERIARESNNQGLPTVYIGDRTLLGFDADAGAAPIEDAVNAALAQEGERVRIVPLAIVAALAAFAFLIGRRRAGATAPSPPSRF